MRAYRVYLSPFDRSGRCAGNYDTFEEAKAKFDMLVTKCGDTTEILLQRMNLERGWVDETIETYHTAAYKDKLDAYRKRLEEEEDDWHAGDAPWEAPGMSIRDFF